MGIEAYRFAINIERKEDKQAIKEKLITLGGILVDEDDVLGSVNIDFTYNEGVIEVLIENPYEIHKGLYGEENIKKVKNQLRVYMRIAKPNSEKVIDKFIDLLKNIESSFGLKGILDLITGKRIDIRNYGELKKDFSEAKKEFEEFYKGIPYPVKCHEVFPKYREIASEYYQDSE